MKNKIISGGFTLQRKTFPCNIKKKNPIRV